MLADAGQRTAARPRRHGSEERPRHALLSARVGIHWLVFELPSILALEAQGQQVEHEAILGPIDLRAWFDVPPSESVESILVPSNDAVYRLEVCEISELVQAELRRIHPVPPVLLPLTTPLCLRGVIELEDERLAFLVDLRRLSTLAWEELDRA